MLVLIDCMVVVIMLVMLIFVSHMTHKHNI